jgi:hypothetical protein
VDLRHLKILEGASHLSRPLRVDASSADWSLYADLWLAGCFEGLPHRDHQNRLDLVEIDRLSARGAEIRDGLYSKLTSVGVWKKYRWQVYAWFFGIIALIVVALIVQWLTKA